MSPLYQFRCPKCSNVIETIQKVNDPYPLCFSDKCGEGSPIEMIREISNSKITFDFKGRGWQMMVVVGILFVLLAGCVIVSTVLFRALNRAFSRLSFYEKIYNDALD